MSWRTILVSLNDTQRNTQTLQLAGRIAGAQDAHLIGMFVIPMMPIYPVPGGYVLPELIESHQAFFAERAEKVKSEFDEFLRRNDLRGEWRQVNSDSSIVANEVIAHGREADLLIISQVSPDNPDGIENDFCDHVIMDTGRPVLVVPYAGKFASVGERVVVGWNARREAARAAFDSLPLLKTASEVLLVWVNPQREEHAAGQLPGSELAASLARHGVKVTAEAMPAGDLDAGDALLNRVADANAGLLVVGAYGHSRLREFVFGGVTRNVLTHMTVPVLMSN